MKVKQNDQEYNRYVEAITPKHSCFKNCLHAFLVGGCICLLGQVIFNVCTTQFHYAAPTIEYKKEGEVFGKGVKVFTIAGPVILFGVVVSFVAGFIYWIFKLL